MNKHATSSNLAAQPAAYYYQMTCYDICDLSMGQPEEPVGPYETPEGRDTAFREEAGEMDLETSHVAAVSFFKVEGSRLALERSFIANPEGGDPIPEDLD